MKKNVLKMILDLLMAITFALLMNPRVLSGLPFHEIAGLVFGVAILTHIGLNFKWVKNTTLKIFNPELSKKARFNYLLNILLLISMSTIIITGILISKIVFPNLAIEGNRAMRGLHDLSANITLALVGLHIGVHWQWILSIFHKMFKSKEGKWRKPVIVSALVSIAILAGGMQWYASTSTSATTMNRFEASATQKFGDDTSGDRNHFRSVAPIPSKENGRGNMKHRGNANSFLVILNYFAIFAALIVPTYYVEKRIGKKRLMQKNITQSE